MKFKSLLLVLVAPALLAGCSSTTTIRVPVAPRVDLGGYQMIGLVEFTSNANDELEQQCTQRFIEAVQAAQPGTRVVELGTEDQALASVERRSWDAATFRAIRAAHGVDVVIMGRLDVQKAKPDIQLSTVWKKLSVRADVEATLSAKLLEAATGASMWSNSAQVTATVAHANFNDRGKGHFGASDPEGTYASMVGDLVYNITDDFRTHYVTRRVSKEQLQTAGVIDQTPR